MKTDAKPTNGKGTAADVKTATIVNLPVNEKPQNVVDLSAKLQKISEVNMLSKWYNRMSEELAVLRSQLTELKEDEKLKIAVGVQDYRHNWQTDHPKLVKEVVSFIIAKYEEKISEIEKEIVNATV